MNLGGRIISEFAGLKSKMYSLVKIKQKKERSQKENKKAKGVNRGVVRDINIKNLLIFCLVGK